MFAVSEESFKWITFRDTLIQNLRFLSMAEFGFQPVPKSECYKVSLALFKKIFHRRVAYAEMRRYCRLVNSVIKGYYTWKEDTKRQVFTPFRRERMTFVFRKKSLNPCNPRHGLAMSDLVGSTR